MGRGERMGGELGPAFREFDIDIELGFFFCRMRMWMRVE